jgi:hypothetical protein
VKVIGTVTVHPRRYRLRGDARECGESGVLRLYCLDFAESEHFNGPSVVGSKSPAMAGHDDGLTLR